MRTLTRLPRLGGRHAFVDGHADKLAGAEPEGRYQRPSVRQISNQSNPADYPQKVDLCHSCNVEQYVAALIVFTPAVLYVIWLLRNFKSPSGQVRLEQAKSGLKEIGINPTATRVKVSNLVAVPLALGVVAFVVFWVQGEFEYIFEGYATIFDVALLLGLIPGVASLSVIFMPLLVLVANHAEKKNRSWVAFLWLSLVLSPAITGLVVASIAPTRAT